MSAHIFSTQPSLTPNAARRLAERQRRQDQLIHALRRVAFLCSLEHNDTCSLVERTHIAALVERVDAHLRKLLNQAAQKRR